jgi:hypothetical protein
MATKFSIYKYVKLEGKGWRYLKAAFHEKNGKIKPDVVLVKGPNGKNAEEKHPEGSCFVNFNNTWIPVGPDALEAQHQRKLKLNRFEFARLSGDAPFPAMVEGRTPLATAAEKYFSNCEARGLDPKTIRAYRSAVDPFVAQCKKACVEDVEGYDSLSPIIAGSSALKHCCSCHIPGTPSSS